MKTILGIVCLVLTVVNLKAETRQKEFSKRFDKRGIQEIVISNRYGQIEVEQKEGVDIQVSALLVVTAKTDAKADELLDFIQVKDVVTSTFINIETEFGKDMGFRRFFSGIDVNITYKVCLPPGIKVRLIQTEGNVFVDRFNGEINVDIKSGNFKGGILKGGKVYIKQSNGSFDISEVGQMTGEFKNGEIKIDKGKDVNLVADNCRGRLASVGILNIRSTGGEMKLGQIEDLGGSSSSTKYEVQDIGNVLKMDMRGGEMNVRNIHFNFDAIELNATSTKVGLTFMEGAGYELELKHNKSLKLDLPRDFRLSTQPTSERNTTVETGFIGNKRFSGKVFLNLKNGSLFIQ